MQFFVIMGLILLAKIALFGIVNVLHRWNHNPARFLGKVSNAGIWFHEMCHFLAAKLLFLPTHFSDINIKGHLPGLVSGMTAVRSRDPRGLTLLQSILIAFAPVLVGTAIITELWKIIGRYWGSTVWQEWIFISGIVLGILAIMMVAFPSRADYQCIFERIFIRPFTAFRQILIGIGSYLGVYLIRDYIIVFLPWNPYYLEPFIFIGMIIGIEFGFVTGGFIVQKVYQYIFDFRPKTPTLSVIQPSDLASISRKKKISSLEWMKEFSSEFTI